MKKTEIRKTFISKRTVFSSDKVDDLSKKIAENVILFLDFSKINSVNCFLPARNKNEVNTWFILEPIKEKFPHISISVPVCDILSDTMYAARLKEDTKLRENKWGIPEPVVKEVESTQNIDLIIIPLLACDLLGNRVGYGKGFYDKFLQNANTNLQKVGVSFFEPVDIIEDTEATDIPLDVCISPSKAYFF